MRVEIECAHIRRLNNIQVYTRILRTVLTDVGYTSPATVHSPPES